MAHLVPTPGDTQPSNTTQNEKLDKSVESQRQLRARVSTASKLSQLERSAFNIDTKEAFGEFWDKTMVTKRDFDARNEHGAAKVAGKATKMVNSASVVWSDISPVLDLVEDVGSPFAGVAIGTIAFVFTVARNRANMESRISATLKSIQDRLPGIEIYRRIYEKNSEPDDRLKAAITNAYDCFIQFCIATVTFYTMGSFLRWIKAMGHSTFLDEKVSAVEQAMLDIRLICEELLNQNIADLKTLTEEQKKRIEDLSGQVEKLQLGQDDQNLVLIGKLLKLDPYSPETELANLKKHRDNIAAEFKQTYTRQRTPGGYLASVKKHQAFQSWHESTGSCILVLVGRNMVREARNCWLSPVGLDLIAECEISKQQSPWVSYILGIQEADDSFTHVVTSLLFRLLSMNPHVLRDENQYSELRAELHNYEKETLTGSQTHILQDLLGKVTLRVLNLFHSFETVWIILDRLDQCRGSGSRNLHRKTLLKLLVKLVESENLRVRVRVLAVVNGVDWMPEEQHDELGQTKDGSIMFLTLDQRQHMMSNYERSYT
ncbi:hypothetical protein F4825DRAFT_436404 [Nemania diffusa]|nr:hypothetical protein F4825DRAFT_436404 [Nemania diffusa]